MSRRPAGQRRLLRLWTATWLAVLLAVGVSRLGDWSVQWPVMLVPLLWALSAVLVRPDRRRYVEEHDEPSYWDGPDHWGDDGDPYRPQGRTDTVEAPWVRDDRQHRRG